MTFLEELLKAHGGPQGAQDNTLTISDRWDIIGYPNGGYLAALAASVMAQATDHKDPLTISAHFLGHPTAGPASFDARLIDYKKSMSRTLMTLNQNDQATGMYLATFTDFSQTKGETLTSSKGRVLPSIGTFVPLNQLPFMPLPPAFSAQFDLRVKPDFLARPNPGNKAEVEGWMTFAQGIEPDLYSLILFADAFPPTLFCKLAPEFWGSIPTIEYTVHLKVHPCPGPIYGRFVTDHMVSGLLEVDGELWDCEGNLVAVSRQVAKLRLPSGSAV
ncbi:thioesterase family protein [Pseudomonas sp. 10C3]|uniref:thioesterase family protein n=2 Tax=unclassified Pseudomonas TaxID=196821 RepID=UPI002E80BF25|nr:thioesterase family protein [Pseudomonas sp. 10C3]MEE3507578.1 thioesterase family protein [Pseudomonas sp. 10C3]